MVKKTDAAAPPKEPKAPKAVTKPKGSKTAERQKVYETPSVKLAYGDDAVTVEQMKAYLGWDEAGPSEEPVLTDLEGKKIVFRRSTRNRPFKRGWADTIAQDRLNNRWRFNGEAIVIDEYGEVASGQHRGAGLILAEQMRTGEQKRHWESIHTGPLTLETVIVFGVDSSPETVRTIDNVSPRTLADVLYTEDAFTKVKKPSDRKALCSMLDNAVRLLWYRTGADDDAFTPKRTHSEALDFITRHKRIIKCVQHIHEEDPKNTLGKMIGRGYAAGLMYLMAASDTDGDHYRNMDNPSERKIDFAQWDLATEYWTLLCANADAVAEVRKKVAYLTDPETMQGGGSRFEIMAVIEMGWLAYKSGVRKITKADLRLRFKTDVEGFSRLIEYPDVGGIDVGEELGLDDDKPVKAGAAGGDEGGDDDAKDDSPLVPEMSPEELEAAKAKEREARAKEEARAELRRKLLANKKAKEEAKAKAQAGKTSGSAVTAAFHLGGSSSSAEDDMVQEAEDERLDDVDNGLEAP
jgi:hypothetical protein